MSPGDKKQGQYQSSSYGYPNQSHFDIATDAEDIGDCIPVDRVSPFKRHSEKHAALHSLKS